MLDSECSRTKGKKKIYIAAPLFSASEQAFNKEIKRILSQHFEIFLPQEDGGMLSEFIEGGMNIQEAAQAIFGIDIVALNQCDILIIILDGRTIDEGASFELGYAYAQGKPCYGIQTDSRRLLRDTNNPMIQCACLDIFQNLEQLLQWAEDQTVDKKAASFTQKGS